MGKLCKSCKKQISANEKPFQCVSCNTLLHMTTECTLLSQTAITGLRELGVNCMLLCNACVDKSERDNFIRCRAQTVSENSKVGEELTSKA